MGRRSIQILGVCLIIKEDLLPERSLHVGTTRGRQIWQIRDHTPIKEEVSEN